MNFDSSLSFGSYITNPSENEATSSTTPNSYEDPIYETLEPRRIPETDTDHIDLPDILRHTTSRVRKTSENKYESISDQVTKVTDILKFYTCYIDMFHSPPHNISAILLKANILAGGIEAKRTSIRAEPLPPIPPERDRRTFDMPLVSK